MVENASLLASGGRDGRIKLWRLPKLEVYGILEGHAGSVNCLLSVRWSPRTRRRDEGVAAPRRCPPLSLPLPRNARHVPRLELTNHARRIGTAHRYRKRHPADPHPALAPLAQVHGLPGAEAGLVSCSSDRTIRVWKSKLR